MESNFPKYYSETECISGLNSLASLIFEKESLFEASPVRPTWETANLFEDFEPVVELPDEGELLPAEECKSATGEPEPNLNTTEGTSSSLIDENSLPSQTPSPIQPCPEAKVI